MLSKLKSLLQKYARVLKITRKPSGEEFKAIVKVSAIGLALIGLIGFTIQVAYLLIK